MGNVLVQHDAVQHRALVNITTWDLLDTSVALYVNLFPSAADILGDYPHSLEGKAAHELRPARDKLCADGGGDQRGHGLVVAGVDRNGNFFNDFKGIAECSFEGGDDDDWMDVAFELGKSLREYFSGCGNRKTTFTSQVPRPFSYAAALGNWHVPSTMTVVVPSPTSSSCVLLSSIMLLAAGCATSISRSMAWPSLVRTMPPIGSSSILSIALGPRHDRMISATLATLSISYFDTLRYAGQEM